MVVTESCGKNNTYKIRGRDAVFVGEGALHDKKYDAMARYFEFESDTFHNSLNFCHQHVYIFPTDTLKKSYQTKKPIHYAAIIVSMFIFAALIFFMYDWFVTNRQNKTEQKADQTSAIVRELFPGNVAAKLFDSERKDNDMVGDVGVNSSRKTIAELYPAATVLCKLMLVKCTGLSDWFGTNIFGLLCMQSPILLDSLLGAPRETPIRSSCFWRLYFRLLILLPRSVVSTKWRRLVIVMLVSNKQLRCT